VLGWLSDGALDRFRWPLSGVRSAVEELLQLL
jgi:hypothetical protein